MRVLIAGVGYPWLRDLALGPVIVRKLKSLEWPETVEIEDMSHNPVAGYQTISEKKYDKIIFVGATKRDRNPGTIYKYRPDKILPDEEEIRERIGESVSGTISLDNILIISKFYGALPADVVVIEVEPEDDSWGDNFTPGVDGLVDKVIEMVMQEAQVAMA